MPIINEMTSEMHRFIEDLEGAIADIKEKLASIDDQKTDRDLVEDLHDKVSEAWYAAEHAVQIAEEVES